MTAQYRDDDRLNDDIARQHRVEWTPFISGTCELREHDTCRMYGCECACHLVAA